MYLSVFIYFFHAPPVFRILGGFSAVPVFDAAATDWPAARPVLSPRFVTIYKAVYGAIAAQLDAKGLMETVNTLWIKDEPLYADCRRCSYQDCHMLSLQM